MVSEVRAFGASAPQRTLAAGRGQMAASQRVLHGRGGGAHAPPGDLTPADTRAASGHTGRHPSGPGIALERQLLKRGGRR